MAALANLLPSLDPSGLGIGPAHPPVAVRIRYMLQAAQILGLDVVADDNAELKSRVAAFWSELKSKDSGDPWCSIFDDQQVHGFVGELKVLLERLQPAAYSTPSDQELASHLRKLEQCTPPVGYEIQLPDTVHCYPVDFRQILYAGWIANSAFPSISFDTINRLCEHAIMQQRAIQLRLGG